MSLKISNQKGTYIIEGKINSSTANYFRFHIEFLFKKNIELVINIDKVAEIDRRGVSALKALYMYALVHNKQLYITGDGCKKIYHDFRYDSVA